MLAFHEIINSFSRLSPNKLVVSDHSRELTYSELSLNGSNLASFLKKKDIRIKKNNFLKRELIKPTKIYVNEILNLINNKLLHGCANITGGGLADNVKRIIPQKLCASIDLDKIKPLKIFKWLKKNNISDHEMIKTFNCGVGFCLVINPKNLKKIDKFFSKEFKPYVIGKIIQNTDKVKLNAKISWI